MMKMVIELDEERIEREGKYGLSLEEMWQEIDDYFEGEDAIKESKGIYLGRGDSLDFSRFGSFYIVFCDKDWLTENLLICDWYEYSEDDPEDYSVESCISVFNRNRMRKKAA